MKARIDGLPSKQYSPPPKFAKRPDDSLNTQSDLFNNCGKIKVVKSARIHLTTALLSNGYSCPKSSGRKSRTTVPVLIIILYCTVYPPNI